MLLLLLLLHLHHNLLFFKYSHQGSVRLNALHLASLARSISSNMLPPAFNGSPSKRTIRSSSRKRRICFCINDHRDVLVEILKRLDARSLGVAACVCRLWCSITRNDAVWEHLCFRHVSPPPSSSGVKTVVVALGGYKRLYMVCVQPALSRLDRRMKKQQQQLRVLGAAAGPGHDSEVSRRVWRRHGAQLSLSLFCVDYYEKLGGRLGDPSSASSLMFLCDCQPPPVNF
ncbi:hypothetical protein Dimus_009763 [Dionaea muscipula]